MTRDHLKHCTTTRSSPFTSASLDVTLDFELQVWNPFEPFDEPRSHPIEQSLKSPKKSVTAPKPKAPAVPAKAAPAATTNAGAAAAPSKAVPKKADPKSPPKGKGKGHGKPLAPEKAKTPCIFHQMPSGCVHGAKCAYSHAAKAPPSKFQA